MKKIFALFFILIFSWAFSLIDFQKSSTDSGCPFCRETVLDSQVFYRGETVFALIPYKPIVPGHVLVISKRHVERFEQLEPAELAEIGATLVKIDGAVKKIVGNTGSDLLEKNGREAGQTVPHVHFHYLPRSKDQSELTFLVRFFLIPWLKPLTPSEMEEIIPVYSAACNQ